MTGIIDATPSEREDEKTDLNTVGDDVYDIGDEDSDMGLNDDYDGARNEILFDASHESLLSGVREMSPKKKAKKKFISLDTMCGPFTADANSTVGVDVSCGAIPAFTKEDPYLSAGLSLVSSGSPSNGFFSSNHRRRKRPTRISSMPASSPSNDTIIVERRLRTSDVKFTSTRRKRSNQRVERFNYAKALLRSDNELEKLSLKIRSEINESELFELAQAAEKAAALGVDNFFGRASTFGGEQHRQWRKEPGKPGIGSPMSAAQNPAIRDKTKAYSLAKIASPSQTKPQQLQEFENDANRNSEQSLLDHARAAAAVVVAKQVQQLQPSTIDQIRKEPAKRSMGIDSLRDVNEVIPVWKELHDHMRTHFYLANVEKNSLFFSEIETLSTSSSKASSTQNYRKSVSPETKDIVKDDMQDQRKKSFFDNLTGMKLLPNFQPKEAPLIENVDSQSYNETEDNGASRTDDLETPQPDHHGSSPSSQKSLENKASVGTTTMDLSAPSTLINSDEYQHYKEEKLPQESKDISGDELNSQATHLTPRLPTRSESFDREVLHISTEDMPVSLEQPSDDESSSDSDEDDYDHSHSVASSGKNAALGSQFDYEDEYAVGESGSSSPEEKRESSLSSPLYEPLSPVSPSKSYILSQSSPRFLENPSPAAPTTPINSVVPSSRRSSGFSTPAHLRIIKRIHSNSISEDNRSSSNDCLDDTKPQHSQSAELQEGVCTSTPATGAYAQFEPNSIVQESSGRSPQILTVPPSFEYAKPANLDLPAIPSMKCETAPQKVSRNFGRRIDRTQWKTGSVSPPHSPTTSMASSKLIANEGEDKPSALTEEYPLVAEKQTQSREVGDGVRDDSKGKELQLGIGSDARKESVSQYDDTIDEKKECDSATTSCLKLSTRDESEKSPRINSKQRALGSFPMRAEEKIGRSSVNHDKFVLTLRTRIEKSKLTTKPTDKTPLANGTLIKTFGSDDTSEKKELEQNHSMCTDDENSQELDFDKISVCHSMPQTEVSFKDAVQTVQGVAAQTVQEVFSHLSLGSPKSQLQSREWQAEGENMEFLSNYFYCAKTAKGVNLRRSSIETSRPPEDDANGLVCAEPCNSRDLRCHMFGISTMCGGLIDLLPDEADASEKGQNKNGVLTKTPTRESSSSISMDKMNRNHLHSHSAPDYQEPDNGTWLGMIQKVASERLNLQFQNNENELETSRHRRPYTPPCLSRRLPNPNQTI